MPENDRSVRPSGQPVATVQAGLFERATAYEGLWAGWERVRANQGAAGGDGVTVARFTATTTLATPP